MYAGTIRHRRFAVREHAFRYRIALAYRDLDCVRGFLTRAELSRVVGSELTGPIRLLAAPRSLGIRFNPVSFYYCFEGDDLRWIVAEVTNTPWGERHSYVLGPRGGTMDKALHVSPFMAMDHTYDVRATVPGETLSVHIESRRDGMLAFDATLNLRRRPYRRRSLLGASMRTLVLIYAHGLALKLKGVPHHPHPEVS